MTLVSYEIPNFGESCILLLLTEFYLYFFRFGEVAFTFL